jgi:HEAT repeat protein
VRDVLLRAAVQADSPATRRFLASRLTAGAAEQTIVLGAIAAGRTGAFEASPEQLEALRARLSAPDDGLARLAAMALGKLEDRDALEELIELLSSEDALEVKAAHEALRGISGSDLGAQPSAWRAWLAAEEAWWQEHAPVELQRLASGERKLVHRALQELQRHPLYRHESAPQVAQLLQEEDDLLVLAGCDALGALGSREALPALIDALALSEGALRAAVLRALQPLARRDPELRAFLVANAAAASG